MTLFSQLYFFQVLTFPINSIHIQIFLLIFSAFWLYCCHIVIRAKQKEEGSGEEGGAARLPDGGPDGGSSPLRTSGPGGLQGPLVRDDGPRGHGRPRPSTPLRPEPARLRPPAPRHRVLHRLQEERPRVQQQIRLVNAPGGRGQGGGGHLYLWTVKAFQSCLICT